MDSTKIYISFSKIINYITKEDMRFSISNIKIRYAFLHIDKYCFILVQFDLMFIDNNVIREQEYKINSEI